MSPHSTFDVGTATHVGKVRHHNEDLFLAAPEIGVFAVADGMGGHADGALASATIVEALQSIGHAATASDLLARLEDRVLRANQRLIEVARERGVGVIGSTLAVLLTFEDRYACVWAGDSRVYLVRRGRIIQLSRDHSEVQEMLDRGLITDQEARASTRRNILTRAVGVHDDPELEIRDGELEPGDAFVLCSDGLTGHVANTEILRAVDGQDPQAACDALVALTLERGANDNVTVVIARYQAAPAAAMAEGAPR
jgi:protein phosphatase